MSCQPVLRILVFNTEKAFSVGFRSLVRSCPRGTVSYTWLNVFEEILKDLGMAAIAGVRLNICLVLMPEVCLLSTEQGLLSRTFGLQV